MAHSQRTQEVDGHSGYKFCRCIFHTHPPQPVDLILLALLQQHLPVVYIHNGILGRGGANAGGSEYVLLLQVCGDKKVLLQ